jgi:isoquinoline 1-oxidoreductase
MAFAAVLRPPSYGARLVELDSTVASQLPGVIDIVRDGELVAVLGETDEAAERAAALVDAQWEEQNGLPGRWDMPQLLLDSAQDHFLTQEAGDLDEGFRDADQTLESLYYLPYISIMPMEPRAAVAEWDGDSLTVWAGAQRPFGLRSELASRFELEESAIRVVTPDIGGGFGGKSIFAPAAEAARLARIAGRPVRVAYTRAEEQTWATFRPAALIKIRSGFRNDGTLTAWQYDAYHAGERAMIGRRGSDSPYTTPHLRVSVARADSPLAAGSYRSLGGAVNHFAREVHIDEIAEAVGADPVELRLRHLAEPRYRRVLERAAEDFGWDGRPGSGVGIGLDVGSYSAVCLQVDAQPAEVRVQRVSSALDCGLTVNPDGATNQMEGAIMMGIGNALFEAIDFEQGRLLNANLARYRVPRIVDTPTIEVALVGDADTPSTGAGEPGIVPTAAAISNAVFSATGERHRELPIQRQLRR